MYSQCSCYLLSVADLGCQSIFVPATGMTMGENDSVCGPNCS